jgi:hypothetical protein
MASLRIYIWPEQGEPQRLPHAAFNHRGRKRFPQFASKRQRAVQVIFEDDGQTVGFSAKGHFLAFDGLGLVMLDVQGAMKAASAHHELKQAKRDEVPKLGAVRVAKRQLDELNATQHWELTKTDLDKIKADLTGGQRIPAARGVA